MCKDLTKECRKKLEKIIGLMCDFNDGVCVVCGKQFEECGCKYDLADAYIRKMGKIIEG